MFLCTHLWINDFELDIYLKGDERYSHKIVKFRNMEVTVLDNFIVLTVQHSWPYVAIAVHLYDGSCCI